MSVLVRLLGPVDVLTDDGRPRQLRGVRRKALLTILALPAGRVVASRRLIELMWRDAPPPAVGNALQRHVSHLRTIVGRREAIVARPPGYLLDLGPEPTDVGVAERLVRDAARATRPEDRLDRLRSAVRLWSGPSLAELRDLPWFDDQARRLDETLLRARTELLTVRLELGHGPRMLTELEALAAEHPWHEEIAGLLMRALYAAGRQTEALAVYQRLRKALNEELGIDPGPGLRDLEAAVLRQDPALTAPPPAVVSPVPPAVVPAQLPLAVAGFTGRDADLATLDRLAAEPGAVVIAGTPGVGKTALAVQWAHRVAARFPDGQLYVNLRGYDPEQPVPAAEALAGFLRALGVAGRDVPLGLDERAARYRTALSGRRVLIVLDNAGGAEQIRPLLPGAPGCVAVVTSRDSLAGLVALDGARRLDLGLLPAADAVALLRRLIGARVTGEPVAAERLAELCARLPLALRIAAERAAAEPDGSLATLVKTLGDEQRRLELLDAEGEIRSAVRSVFAWSYHRLPPDAAGAFRAVGLHPGGDFDAPAIAALTGHDVAYATRLCARLARAHLIQPHGTGRYVIHDLLRLYALGLSPVIERPAALAALFDHYLAGAAAAMDTLHPAERAKRPRVDRAATTPPLDTPDTARAWLEAELANLVDVCAYAAAHSSPVHTIRLARVLFRHLDMGGRHAEAMSVHSSARRAARAIGDRSAEARALNNLAAVFWWRARYPQAAEYYRAAAELFRAAGDAGGESDVQANLGLVATSMGDLTGAAGHYERALAICRATGDLLGEGVALTGLGTAYTMTGDLERAAGHLRAALVLRRAAGKKDGEADTLTGLARIHLRRGDLDLAAEQLEAALVLYRRLGYPGREAGTLNTLGVVARRAGEPVRALRYHEQSLTLHRSSGTRRGEAAALNGMGGTLLAMGEAEAARRRHADALRLATEAGDRYEEAVAHDGLAAAFRSRGDHHLARTHGEEASRIFAAIGAAGSSY
ncbi:BTAD domain-containing putative transcriptional regulator [Actinoplanes sp. NPDC051851]|uniref:AfsR/SARP family transcriptional regulator n=1 Tax=Actinoplanes sp. NPDC051851 TaxID=3154753 RepID=UPI00341A8A13